MGHFIQSFATNLQVHLTEKVKDNITNEVLEVLTASCAECGITNDIIDK